MRFFVTAFFNEDMGITPEDIKKALEQVGIKDPEVHIFAASDEPNTTRPRWSNFPPPEHTGEF